MNRLRMRLSIAECQCSLAYALRSVTRGENPRSHVINAINHAVEAAKHWMDT